MEKYGRAEQATDDSLVLRILSRGIKNQLDVTCYFYFTYYLLNMFRTLICPSSGACDCVDGITTSVILFSFRCVLVFAADDVWWCPFCRLKH